MNQDYTKSSIISEIVRTTEENNGVVLGQLKFEEVTGISRSKWRGRYWRNWSEAVSAAGLAPNTAPDKIDDTTLIHHLSLLTQKLGYFPTYSDLLLEKRQDDNFPNYNAFKRLGKKADHIEHVREYATKNAEFTNILENLPKPELNNEKKLDSEDKLTEGFVYLALMKIGNQKRYKIGKAVLAARRVDQISIQLPEELKLVHHINTDDAFGIETYWHKRFHSKNTKGEWFSLSQGDVRAFKKRKFM